MLLSRRIDDKEIQLKNQSLIFFQISGAGHEAVLTAAGMHLRPGYDWFYPYYRDRALCLHARHDAARDAAGRRRREGRSEFRRPADAVALGPQAAQHPVAGQPDRHAVPARGRRRRSRHDLRARHRRSPIAHERFHADEVTYLSIGEGATSEGEFWESLNTACTRSVPVLYLVEDNGYAISVPVEVQTPGGDISRLVESFPNLKVCRCDGTDFLESYRTLGEAAAYVRRERKPAFVHAKVIRPYSHSLSDDERLYKTPDERKAEALRDPLTKMRAFLLPEQIATDGRPRRDRSRRSIARSPRRPTPRSRRRSRRSIPPTAFVFSPTVDPTSTRVPDAARSPRASPTRWSAAINRTLKDEMARNPRIVVFGEDVADASKASALPHVPGKGGVFKVTHGLQKAYGADRVFNSPLAEANIVGRAVGMATRGLKPVVEIQFFDYIWPAMMQLKDEMSMLRYRSGNNWSCPMVVRVPIGGYLRGGAPYHSQSGVSIFAHCPGIRIVFPSNAIDAAGLLRTAIRCDDPVLYLEHKHLYRQTYNKGVYPGADYMIPFGKGSLRRDGTDMVVLTWGALVQRSLLAAQQAEKDGISVAVFDLRTIMPYDWDGIAGARAEDEQRDRRARRHADLRLRRRDRGAHRRRAVRIPRCAGQARRRARLPGRLLPRPRREDPAAVVGRARGDQEACGVLEAQKAEVSTVQKCRTACALLVTLWLLPLPSCFSQRPAASKSCKSVSAPAPACRRPLPRSDRLQADRQRRLLRLRSARPHRVSRRRVRRRRRKLVQIGAEDGPADRAERVRCRDQRQLRRGRCAERPRARADLRRRRRPHRRVHPAGPRRVARRAGLAGVERRRHARVHRPHAAHEPSGIGVADDRVRARRHAAAIDRTAAQDRSRSRSRSASRAEFRHPDRRSERRVLFRVHGRRAGVPQVRRQGRAGLRARRPGPRDRSAGRGHSRSLAAAQRRASCRSWRRPFEPRP